MACTGVDTRHPEFHTQLWADDSNDTRRDGGLDAGTGNGWFCSRFIYLNPGNRKQFYYTHGAKENGKYSTCAYYHCAAFSKLV